MNKQQLLEEFMVLIAAMQNIAVDIVDNKSYNDVGEFLDAVFENLQSEEIDETVGEIKRENRTFGYVDRERVMQGIGDDQALLIFGEPVKYDSEDI